MSLASTFLFGLWNQKYCCTSSKREKHHFLWIMLFPLCKIPGCWLRFVSWSSRQKAARKIISLIPVNSSIGVFNSYTWRSSKISRCSNWLSADENALSGKWRTACDDAAENEPGESRPGDRDRAGAEAAEAHHFSG